MSEDFSAEDLEEIVAGAPPGYLVHFLSAGISMRHTFTVIERGLRDRGFGAKWQRRIFREFAAGVRDGSWELRRAVAHALRFFPDGIAVERLLRKLLVDEDEAVAAEARRTMVYRIEQSLRSQLPFPFDERMQQELLELETEHDRPTRDAAVHFGLSYAEFLVNAMNHQVNTAMNPVGIALQELGEMLGDREGLDKERERVHSAHTHFGHAAAVLKHAATYVRLSPPRYEAVVLRDLVESAVYAARNLSVALELGRALEIAINIADKLEIDAVEDLLREALLNVLKNAIEASTERRPVRLWVAAEANARDVVLSIRDQGCGMTIQQYTREIWRPFRSKKAGGMGLGMPLVRKIVEIDHRGHVNVASEQGVGTTVTMRLPVSQRF